MGLRWIFSKFLLLFTAICFLATPLRTLSAMPESYQEDKKMDWNELQKSSQNCSYDAALRLLEEIENDELEDKYSPAELLAIDQFITFLAKEGMVSEDPDEHTLFERDVEEFLEGQEEYRQACYAGDRVTLYPAVFHGEASFAKCGWLKKQYKKTKKFVKDYKKEIIIGAVVVVAVIAVVAVVMVVSSSTAATAAAAGAAAAAGGGGEAAETKKTTKANEVKKANPNAEANEPASTEPSPSADTELKPNHKKPPSKTEEEESAAVALAMQEQVADFKYKIAQSDFLPIVDPTFPIEEHGRVLGQILAHSSFEEIVGQPSFAPKFSPFLENSLTGHQMVESSFTPPNTVPCFFNGDFSQDFDSTAHAMHGDRAAELGCYNQAIFDYSQAIKLTPDNYNLYLDRSAAHLESGSIEQSLADYEEYNIRKPDSLESAYDFSKAFIQGVPRGVKDSVVDLGSFAYDVVTHPINTAKEMGEAFSALGKLVYLQEWETIRETLAPEVCELVTNWENLSPEERGDLAGYAVGKHGADLFTPNGPLKSVLNVVKETKEVSKVVKAVNTADKILKVESASVLENGFRVSEAVQNKTIIAAEMLGFNSHEIAQIKNIGKIDESFNSIAKNIPNTNQGMIFTNHALERAIERGVSRESILEALKFPLEIKEIKIDKLGRSSQRFIGQKAEVVINPETQQIVSVNPTATKKIKKITKDFNNVQN